MVVNNYYHSIFRSHHSNFSLARWSKRDTWLKMSHLKLGNIWVNTDLSIFTRVPTMMNKEVLFYTTNKALNLRELMPNQELIGRKTNPNRNHSHSSKLLTVRVKVYAKPCWPFNKTLNKQTINNPQDEQPTQSKNIISKFTALVSQIYLLFSILGRFIWNLRNKQIRYWC